MTKVETVLAILASAVIVLGGLAALARSIFKVASQIRDNTKATNRLTDEMSSMTQGFGSRITVIEARIVWLKDQYDKLAVYLHPPKTGD